MSRSFNISLSEEREGATISKVVVLRSYSVPDKKRKARVTNKKHQKKNLLITPGLHTVPTGIMSEQHRKPKP
jgi:hypothetical protein